MQRCDDGEKERELREKEREREKTKGIEERRVRLKTYQDVMTSNISNSNKKNLCIYGI